MTAKHVTRFMLLQRRLASFSSILNPFAHSDTIRWNRHGSTLAQVIVRWWHQAKTWSNIDL